jgi:hypothetical protein
MNLLVKANAASFEADGAVRTMPMLEHVLPCRRPQQVGDPVQQEGYESTMVDQGWGRLRPPLLRLLQFVHWDHRPILIQLHCRLLKFKDLHHRSVLVYQDLLVRSYHPLQYHFQRSIDPGYLPSRVPQMWTVAYATMPS